MTSLPSRVHDQKRRTVSPGKFSAAWGQPPITLRCGVAKPVTLTNTSPCFGVDGVGWFAEQTSAGYRFTTIGRRTYVEVGVPSSYAPEADALVDVAAPLTRSDPLVRSCG